MTKRESAYEPTPSCSLCLASPAHVGRHGDRSFLLRHRPGSVDSVAGILVGGGPL